ncbi:MULTISPECIES: histidine kinase [unclassified Streptomyces]|uniref:sensor histidine kinase n=1 Tax=unclassified Streptomyces TaxID=2593676 RepID=UPI002DD94D50|nr:MULTISPECIES: histidine kinase [unclassified Streptomyces]WSA93390.1 histidine kinase [Streptomyces sp. NBC_01795]WSB77759.1 histidine kinase [Streptomyces sp. NBC_01775]WSS13993.1 histidine kinase [Streptomyces sp. NBC_01186]WSS42813.1 histidine kinase [Streptomyces sp. NBC_01187]
MREDIGRARRASAHLGTAAGLSIATYLFVPLLMFTAVAVVFVVGAGVVPETVQLLRRTAAFKRRQVAAWTGTEIPEAYPPLTGTLVERVRTATRDPSTYQDLRWMAAHYVYGLAPALAAMPLAVLTLCADAVWCGLLGRPALTPQLLVRLADADAGWSRTLLEPTPEAQNSARLAERVEELTVTREGALTAHGAELRRIERDLHDGTQAHLVALSMRVGLARRAYEKDPDAARKLLDDAQDQAEAALTELRHVVRGIHPPILTDRGLVGAVRALAAGSGLEVAVRADGVEGAGVPRAPAAVETAAYFVVAEALTNAAKHSGSERAWVELVRDTRTLTVSVRDEGCGGADSSGGSGLLGVRRRVAALDGTVEVTSPTGGPTVIEVELPCA